MQDKPINEVLLESSKIPLKNYFIEVIKNFLTIDLYVTYRAKGEELDNLTSFDLNNCNLKTEFLPSLQNKWELFPLMEEAAKKLHKTQFTSEMLLKIFELMPNIKEYCQAELQNWYNYAKKQIICQFPKYESIFPEVFHYDIDFLFTEFTNKN